MNETMNSPSPDIRYPLAMAKRGIPVFPLRPNTKKPYSKKDMDNQGWKKYSTINRDTIEGWAKKYHGCNFAVDCEKAGLFIPDIDNKNGKKGSNTLKELERQYGPLPDTLIIKTPTGGFHFYLRGRGKSTNRGEIGPDIDSKSVGGYVVAPGSVIDGKMYEPVTKEFKIADAPSWIIDRAGRPLESLDQINKDPLCEYDLLHNIDAAKNYLTNEAPEAIEDLGGDQTTYNVACRLHDMGISQETALRLMLEHWNDTKAQPSWSPRDLDKKVANAFSYAKDRPGNATPEAKFPLPKDDKEGLFTSVRDLRNADIQVEYVVKPYIERDTVTVWFGGFAEFKTFVAISLGISKAAGISWAGSDLQPGPVWYIAGEGRGGMQRRIEAACIKLGLPKDVDIPFLVSNHDLPLDSPAAVDNLLNRASVSIDQYGSPDVVFVDTIATHFGGGDENGTKDMSRFVNTAMMLRRRLECAIVLLHHPGHGDKTRSRGAYCLEAGVDAVFRIHREDMHVCLNRPKKMKDGEPPPDTWFKAHIVNVGVDEDLKPITSLALAHDPIYQPASKPKKLGANQQFLLDQIPPEGIAQNDLHKDYKEWKGGSYNRQGFYRALNILKDQNIVFEDNGLLFRAL